MGLNRLRTLFDSVMRMPYGYRIMLRIVVALIIAAASNILISSFIDTPKISKIKRDNHHLVREFSILQEKIAASEQTLQDIKHRDHYVYRPLLGIDTITDPEILRVYSDYNDDKYAPYANDKYSELIVSGWRNLDHLTRQTYYASISLDKTQELATNKEEFSTVIPAIWPIDRTKLRSVSSLYGMRRHPRYGTWRKHEGVDLAAPKGTPVYATGNAVVSQACWRPGYGKLIELNHGFGYKTRYGHLSKIYINAGDSVTRGQVIGEVGNTGVSEDSHLHYEVRYRGNTVNPIHYFNKDMSPEAYVELMNQIEESTTKN
ncbi:MAG: M23 family metallopeptidase [Alistipes sp.]|nr:M23 family metallopeptidase [Alistipes sp.]